MAGGKVQGGTPMYLNKNVKIHVVGFRQSRVYSKRNFQKELVKSSAANKDRKGEDGSS